MKIAFMTCGTINGSLSYRPLALAREYVKNGHDVYVFSPRFDKYSKFIDEKITEIDGVKVMRPLQIKTFSFELGLIPYILSCAFMLHKLNPDIIHIYKSNPVTLIGLLPHFTKRIPVVFDTDDIDSEVMKVEKNSYLKVKLVQLSEKFVSRYSSAISVGSKYLQKLYSSKYSNKIVAYIPNGAEFINTNKININKISNNRVVFIGNINRKNILEPLFYSLNELSNQKININAVIIGDGIHLNYFKKLAKKLAIDKQIRFLGWVPQDQLYKHVQVGDIGYSYMPNELTVKACSSIKVFQYMQFGAVPLVSNVGDFPTYTFNGKAGYIAKHSNLESLTQKLIYALSNKNDRREKINYAIKNAKNRYMWSVLANQTEDIYKKIS